MLQINAMAILSLFIAACNVQPSSIIPYSTSALPVKANTQSQNGSIFQAQSYKPLFENYRARAVGDVLTIVISEKISADKANSSSDNKSSSINAKITSFFGLASPSMQAVQSNELQSKGNNAGSASYNFVGTIGATVLEVRANGDLVVSGEKLIGMDKGTEFIRISGVVVPIMMDQGNSILSTKLADARVEYRTNSQIDQAELLKSFGRFFSTFLFL